MPAASSTPLPFSLPSIDASDVDAVISVLRSGWLTTGGECAALEAELASYLEVDHAVGVASCTHALEICLHYLDLPRGSRVGVPDWTFVSTALAAVHVGHMPVLLDVDADTLNLSPESLAASIGDLDAVIAVHFGGSAVDEEIHRICADHGVPLIEDAAHALGGRDTVGPINGSRTSGACFSFYATKNLTSGEGGAITTSDTGLADFARSFRLHGLSKDAWKRYMPDGTPLYDLTGPGIKANLPDLLAGLARSQLRRFGAMQARRRVLVDHYRARLRDVAGVTLVPRGEDPGSADHLLVILLPEDSLRPHVVQALTASHISSSVHFQPLHRFAWIASNVAVGPSGTETCERLADRALSLPLYPDLSRDDVDLVVDVLAASLGEERR